MDAVWIAMIEHGDGVNVQACRDRESATRFIQEWASNEWFNQFPTDTEMPSDPAVMCETYFKAVADKGFDSELYRIFEQKLYSFDKNGSGEE